MQLKKIHNTIFYPCCGRDLNFPINLFGNENIDYIFCDIKKYSNWDSVKKLDVSLSFLQIDAWQAVEKLTEINILFYRRDGMSEGGSGIEVLGNEFLKILLTRFSPEGGQIITDGSNAWGDQLEKLKYGLVSHSGFNISLSDSQKYARDGLITFNVKKQ